MLKAKFVPLRHLVSGVPATASVAAALLASSAWIRVGLVQLSVPAVQPVVVVSLAPVPVKVAPAVLLVPVVAARKVATVQAQAPVVTVYEAVGAVPTETFSCSWLPCGPEVAVAVPLVSIAYPAPAVMDPVEIAPREAMTRSVVPPVAEGAVQDGLALPVLLELVKVSLGSCAASTPDHSLAMTTALVDVVHEHDTAAVTETAFHT